MDKHEMKRTIRRLMMYVFFMGFFATFMLVNLKEKNYTMFAFDSLFILLNMVFAVEQRKKLLDHWL